MSHFKVMTEVLSFEQQLFYLQKVSRSFALTIPLLDTRLSDIIANAYLHLRIVDTIEDDENCNIQDKVNLLEQLAKLYDQLCTDTAILNQLKTLKSQIMTSVISTNSYENALIKDYDKLFARSLGYDHQVFVLICHTAAIMCQGMAYSLTHNITTKEDVDSYCYSVAGVVGEFLANLICLDLKDNVLKEQLIKLSVSFGEGLQLTNILKDRSKDKQRAAFFLPYHNNDTDELKLIDYYMQLCCAHLDNALLFIQKLPKSNNGFALFCLFNVAMAYATIKTLKYKRNRYKITKRQVKILYVLSILALKYKFCFKLFSLYLKNSLCSSTVNYQELYTRVSKWHNFSKKHNT